MGPLGSLMYYPSSPENFWIQHVSEALFHKIFSLSRQKLFYIPPPTITTTLFQFLDVCTYENYYYYYIRVSKVKISQVLVLGERNPTESKNPETYVVLYFYNSKFFSINV